MSMAVALRIAGTGNGPRVRAANTEQRATTHRRSVSGRRGRGGGQAAAAGELVARAVAVLGCVTFMSSTVTAGADGHP